MSKYTLHYRSTDQPLILSDVVFTSFYYGQIDYRALLIRDETSAYLSARGYKQAYKIGQKLLLDQKRYNKFLQEVKAFNSQLKNNNTLVGIKKLKGKKFVEVWQKIDKVVHDFSRLYFYLEQPILAPLEDVIIKECKSEDQLIDILKNYKRVAKYNLSPKAESAVQALMVIGKLKLAVHKNFGYWMKAMYIYAEVIAGRHNLSLQQVLSMRSFEFNLAITKGKIPNTKILNDRWHKGCVLLPPKSGNKWQCLTGNHYINWKSKLQGKLSDKIRGATAYPGKVKGKVFLHLKWVGISDIPKGAVLVVGNTNPQIVPLLKNVSAIVTDEGGMTCHAAIISRELKIPCVVGTQNGTQIFKNGDLVEVDANKGVVKILK